jgi:radical SAM superfamily enzyme YgiQ (UPF0313 family)
MSYAPPASPRRSSRVLLVYPPISKQERYSSEIGAAGGNQIPLGVFYLAAKLRRLGHEAKVIDGEAENRTAGEIVRAAVAWSATIVGISSTTVAFHRALELAQALKARRSELPIVLGGPHITSNYRHAMGHAEFDYGVVGEGERTLPELCAALENGSPVADIPGVVYRHGEELAVNPPRELIADLDPLPFPAFDLVPDMRRYTPPPSNYMRLPVANVITARGCPSQCTFCDRNLFGQRLRQRSAGNVADEIELLYRRYGVREIAFVDDTFTLGKKRIYEIFNLLDEREIRIVWTCMSRVNGIDAELLTFMREHGCWHISFGIESGNEEVLRRIKKHISLQQVERAVALCRDAGIKTKGFFILGHPGETAETVRQTIDFALRLPIDDIVATINTPIPGSPQYAEARQYGTLDETDWSQFNYWRPVFVPHGLSREFLLEKHRELYRRFYLRPRVLFRYAASMFSASGPRRLVSLAKSARYLLKRRAA